MTVFQADCPHCGTRAVGFTIVNEIRATKVAEPLWDTLAVCGRCSRGTLASFMTPDGDSPLGWLSRRDDSAFLGEPVIAPSRPNTEAPEHTAKNVSEFYRQGMENLPGNWDAAGAMFRKALDTALKNKFPEIKGKLHKRIETAQEKGELTPALAEWSHQIRLDGNEAAHGEEPLSQEDAERLQTFTHLVPLYMFTLPRMLADAKGESQSEAAQG